MRRKQRAFTLIEALIVLAIVTILASVVTGAFKSRDAAAAGYETYGLNGATETRCIAGFKHIVDNSGSARQILNEQGHGIPCGAAP